MCTVDDKVERAAQQPQHLQRGQKARQGGRTSHAPGLACCSQLGAAFVESSLSVVGGSKSGLHSQGLEQLAHSLSWFRATLRNFDRFDGCLPDSIFGSAIGLQTAY